MIGRLSGRLVNYSPGRVLLDVAGVGYDLQISLNTYYSLGSVARSQDEGRGSSPVSLHVHTHVREDALQLFGFATLEERTHFEKLIGISGVGPRMAMAVLSGINGDELRKAVLTQDRERFQKIPGVGKKTAERVLLELRDKLGLDPELVGQPPGAAGYEPGPGEGNRADAASALVNLGYSKKVAESAVVKTMESLGVDATLETILKSALGRLVER